MQDATHPARLAISFAFSSALSARTTRHAALLGIADFSSRAGGALYLFQEDFRGVTVIIVP